MRLAFPVLFLLAATACGIPEDDFSEDFADAVCDRAKRCDPDFDDVYEDKRDCRDAQEEWADLLLGAAGFFGGEYDPGAGGACVRAVRRGSCADYLDGDWSDVCEAVVE